MVGALRRCRSLQCSHCNDRALAIASRENPIDFTI
jgi:hypothetical protein